MVLSGVLLAGGCGSKKEAKPATEGVETHESAPATLTKFQQKLVETTITEWEPTSNSGAQFLYSSLSFQANGTWSADGVVKADFEEFPCSEKGLWTVTSEDNGSAGTVEWTLKETDCITREVGASLRTHISFSGGDYKISFR